ncbi:MAG: TetR/AcrR family transcriptional regulator [Propioniciclava sp.]
MPAAQPRPTVTERLLVGARELLAREGVSALTARKVASESGRSTMCVYTAFGNVSGMLDAVYRDVADELTAELTEGAPAQRYRTWATAHPELYHLLFDVDLHASGVDPSRRSALVATIAETLSPDDCERGSAIWAILHGVTSLERIDGDAGPALTALGGHGDGALRAALPSS